MKKRFVWPGVVLVGLLLIAAVMGAASTSSSVWSGRYRVGETVLFKVEDQKVFCWCCCCQPACPETQVLGWHIADSSGGIVYSVVNDAPVPASIWQGSWSQINSLGASVAAGYYILCVDTSVGTLSRCLYLYDPCCGCCWGCCGWSCCGWSRCGCGPQSTITSCCSRTSLVWIVEEAPCCHLFFRWPCCSSCP